MVYFIESSGYLKVGFTTNIDNRLKQYATHNPSFKLLYLINGSEQTEKTIHKELKDYNFRLEWFHIDDYVWYVVEFFRTKYIEDVERDEMPYVPPRNVNMDLIEHIRSSVRDDQNFPINEYWKRRWAEELQLPYCTIGHTFKTLSYKDIIQPVTGGIYKINKDNIHLIETITVDKPEENVGYSI